MPQVLDSLLVYVIDELVRQNELKADDISKAMRYAVVAAAAALTSVLVEPLLAIIRWTGAIS